MKNKLIIGLLLATVIFLLLFLKQCSSTAELKQEIALAGQNQRALLDTVTAVKNRAGELQFQKSTLIASEKQLKELNKDLYDEVQKQKGKVMMLSSANAELSSQIAGLETALSEDEGDIEAAGDLAAGSYPKNFKLSWNYDTTFSDGNYRKLSGFTRLRFTNDSTFYPGLTDITKDAMGIKLITGLTKEGDDYKIFVKSDYPGFTVTDIQGAVIPGKNNPLFQGKPQKWGVGFSVGPNISVGRGLQGPAIYVGLGVTFGLTYNIIKF
jgi:hypothetical protein